MTVLFILVGDAKGCASLGGAERQAIYLATEMKKRNIKVSFFCLAVKKGMATDLLDINDIEYRIINILGLNKIFSFMKLIYLLRKNAPNFILSYTSTANLYLGYLSFFINKNISLIWNQRDSGLNFNPFKFYNLYIQRFSLYISNSKEGASFLNKNLGVSKNKIKIIHNGVIRCKYI